VVAAITPFNAPFNLLAHKVAPALAAGNAVVAKPAPQAPLSAFDIAAIMEEAGFPAGAVNVVPGDAEVGSALVTHPGVDLITFTGGAKAGQAIRRDAGLRKVMLELGGNSPNIVHHDANLMAAADACLRGGFGNNGQSCNSVQRVLVHDEVRDAFTAALVAAAGRMVVGDPLDPVTEVGPLVDEASAIRVLSRIEDAVAQGARVLTGGTREGALIGPTVVADAPQECPLYWDEVFAPVILVTGYRNLNEAVEMANATAFGLQAAIFTESLDSAMAAALKLRSGGVMVNRSSNFRLDHLPYGGVGDSGFGREGPQSTVEEMTNLKVIVLSPAQSARFPDA
jgi:acyl-CoA reductase-like NAD-dependent aldehyde dehydrogenase